MPISEKGAPASHFSPENDRERRSGGRKWLATGLEGKPRSEVGGPRSENRHPCLSVSIRGWFSSSDVGGRPKTAQKGILGRFGGSGGPANPFFDRPDLFWESGDANSRKWGEQAGNFSRKTGILQENRRGNGPSSCSPVCFLFSCLVGGFGGLRRPKIGLKR